MKRNIYRAALAIAIMFTVLFIPTQSGATEQESETDVCYEQIEVVYHQLEKHTRERTREVQNQHYSWTGGNLPTWEAPTFPGENWQANTHQEPHDWWQATWIGDSGLHWTGQFWNASWFYFEEGFSEWSEWSEPAPYGTHFSWVTDIPEPNWQEHGNSYTDTYQRDWAELPNGNTKSEFVDGDRIPCEEQPLPEFRIEWTVDCEANLVWERQYETPYELDENFEWVLGEEYIVNEFSNPATVEDCPLPPPPPPPPAPTEIVVAAPTVTHQCEGPSTVTIDDPEHTNYEWFNLPTGLGKTVNFDGPTTVRIAYYVDQDFNGVIPGQNEFIVDIPAPEDCPEVTTTTTTTQPEVVISTTSLEKLPNTGSNTWKYLTFGVLSIALGAATILGVWLNQRDA